MTSPRQERTAGIIRAVIAAAKRIVRVSAHKLIMRGRCEIIGKVGQRNFASVFSGLGRFGATLGLTSDYQGLTVIGPSSDDPLFGPDQIEEILALHPRRRRTRPGCEVCCHCP